MINFVLFSVGFLCVSLGILALVGAYGLMEMWG